LFFCTGVAVLVFLSDIGDLCSFDGKFELVDQARFVSLSVERLEAPVAFVVLIGEVVEDGKRTDSGITETPLPSLLSAPDAVRFRHPGFGPGLPACDGYTHCLLNFVQASQTGTTLSPMPN